MIENIAFFLDVLVFSILSIAWFFLSVCEFCNREANELKKPQSSEERQISSNFIDNQLLKAKTYAINDDMPFIYGNEYVINGKVFTESFKVDKFRQFEVFKLKMDDYADTSGVSIDDDTHLQITLEPVPHGVIINSNVFLSHDQWNTLYLLSEENRRCSVCDVACDVTEHVASSVHVANMERYAPLNKYDLSITRKINNNYHCGVCNILFDQSLKNDHFASKSHEDKLLFAINKVSDIMFDSNIHNNNNIEKKDSYHFNAKAINNNNITNESEDDYNDESGSEDDYDNDDYNYNDHWNPFNGLKYNDDGNYEEPAQNLEFSYASMAKKPKSDELPEVVEVDFGNKKVTVKFNSWNMLIRPMPNRFYCMACKKVDHIRHVAEHCRSREHLERLDACRVVDEYEKYFVRQVDDKCYHCGHCNNLQLINVMEDHINSHHTHPTTIQALCDSPAKKISTPIKTNPAKHTNEVKHDQLNTEHDNNTKSVVKHDVNINKGHETKIEIPNVFSEAAMYTALKAANSNLEDIVICTYGSKLRISKLAYNIVCQGENDYYCGLCEVNISREHLKLHVNDMQHLTRLQRTPFIQAFNVHLFREIRDALHCALCNELIQIMPEFIIKHKYLEKHIVSFNRALGYIKDNTVEVKPKENIDNGAIPKLATVENSKIPTNGVTNINKVSGATIKTNNVVTANKTTPIIKNNVALNNIPSALTKNMPNANSTPKFANNSVPRNNIPAGITNKNAPIANNTPMFANNNLQINTIPPAITNAPVANINTPTAHNNLQPVANKITNIATTNKNVPATNDALNIATATKDPNDLTNEELEAYIKQAMNETRHEEFIMVKNGVKEDIPDDLEDSFIDDFDLEEYVYVKLGNSYIKITNTSYNTLVDVGDGGKYCFVCSSLVDELSKHVESRGHMENMDKFKFVDKYNEDLLRQFYLMYHCSICNVVITRKQLHHHLTWPTHALQTENTKISSKKRKNEIKAGTKQITVTTQKENIYLNEKETDYKIYLNIAIDKERTQVERLNKIVIFNDNVLKVSFDCWHGLGEVGSGFRCKVCQCEFDGNEFGVHVSSEWHKGNLDKIEKQYSPALIRKINDTTLNCVMCNTELSNKKHIVTEHIQGKKHIKHYEAILKESSVANSYADCDQDVLML